MRSWLIGAEGVSVSIGFSIVVRSWLVVSSGGTEGIEGDSAAFRCWSIAPSCRDEQAEGGPISIEFSMAMGS